MKEDKRIRVDKSVRNRLIYLRNLGSFRSINEVIAELLKEKQKEENNNGKTRRSN